MIFQCSSLKYFVLSQSKLAETKKKHLSKKTAYYSKTQHIASKKIDWHTLTLA